MIPRSRYGRDVGRPFVLLNRPGVRDLKFAGDGERAAVPTIMRSSAFCTSPLSLIHERLTANTKAPYALA